jgi:serine protease DegQ
VTVFAQLSREIEEIAARCAPGVVQVDARPGRPATGILWDDNLVVTADHVIEEEHGILVTGPPTSVKASLAGRDHETDLALLRTEGLRAAPLPKGRSTDVRTGHLVLALGNPGQHQVTMGLVSGWSAHRSWRGGRRQALIQTTAELLPGFSGGPLVDTEGRVVGMTSWHFGGGRTMALPIETVDRVAASLRDYGRVRRAYLGLGAQSVPLAEGNHFGVSTGMLVVAVEPGGPAAKAGVLQGDVIVTLDGDPVPRLDPLFDALRGFEAGSVHHLQVVRAGETRELDVTLGERP